MEIVKNVSLCLSQEIIDERSRWMPKSDGGGRLTFTCLSVEVSSTPSRSFVDVNLPCESSEKCCYRSQGDELSDWRAQERLHCSNAPTRRYTPYGHNIVCWSKPQTKQKDRSWRNMTADNNTSRADPSLPLLKDSARDCQPCEIACARLPPWLLKSWSIVVKIE